ncbi:unnamed protein product [Phytomonas sp. EM1]|nr:unnamed protein product [Phytomonas sp. EM1]|eukprot:CCW65838.1 unnamed protein product [Phytomonas sp. isolate EM1]
MPYFGYEYNFDFMEKAIENAKLQPEDVMIVLDSDTLFTGMDINPFLDRFIAQSATTPKKLDAVAVRQGRAMAPLLANAEAACWAPRIFKSEFECKCGNEAAYTKMREYAAAHPERRLSLPFDLSPQRYLNSGAVVARVWAYKEFLQKARNLSNTQIPRINTENGWRCDQSMYAAPTWTS